MKTIPPKRVVMAGAALCLAVTALGACGSEKEAPALPAAAAPSKSVTPSASSTGGGAPMDSQEAFAKFDECMAKHGMYSAASGIKPPPGAKALTQDQQAAAFKACKPVLDAAGIQPAGGAMQEEMKQQMLDIAQCMRDKGHDVPDPQFDDNGGMTITSPRGGGAQDSAQMNKDQQECEKSVGVAPGAGLPMVEVR